MAITCKCIILKYNFVNWLKIDFTFSASPDPPGRPLVNAFTSRSVNLSWTPPLNTHHSPIRHYVIHVREGEGMRWPPDEDLGGIETDDDSTSFRVDDLRPFTTYSFKVAAVNDVGRSKPSDESYYTMTLRTGKETLLANKVLPID